ncbi:MAG: hypothetical protein HOP13_12315 [Alphaproteobacteria bacterium]|nr:hypothetical protein [Alphaproteobacteria bacterium]
MAIGFAKRVFQIAGFWGLFVLSLAYGAYLLGLEGATIDTDRPEFVHGFFLIALAWQVAFLFIATDPVRYRPLMLAAMLEKFPFTLAVLVLYANGQVPVTMLVLGLIDGVLGVLFSIAYIWTDPTSGAE